MAIYLTCSRPRVSWGGQDAVLCWDTAWTLFLPDHVGDVPAGYPEMVLGRLTAWAWGALGDVSGRLRVDRVDPVWFVVPPLTPAALEFVVRVASFWDDEVYWVDDAGQRTGENLWLPPVTDVRAPNLTQALDVAVKGDRDYGPGRNRVLYPHLGFGRLHVMVVEVAPGGASDRLHAHSADDEYYFILRGKGTLRVGAHTTPVEAGMMIGKPLGPDLATQLLADRGEPVTILDLEAWPEPRQETKDVMYYADFGEIHLHGSGWGAVIPEAALYSRQDARAHHHDGYRRELDGTWAPQNIPGAPARETE